MPWPRGITRPWDPGRSLSLARGLRAPPPRATPPSPRRPPPTPTAPTPQAPPSADPTRQRSTGHRAAARSARSSQCPQTAPPTAGPPDDRWRQAAGGRRQAAGGRRGIAPQLTAPMARLPAAPSPAVWDSHCGPEPPAARGQPLCHPPGVLADHRVGHAAAPHRPFRSPGSGDARRALLATVSGLAAGEPSPSAGSGDQAQETPLSVGSLTAPLLCERLR
jgi:hypothetical protein